MENIFRETLVSNVSFLVKYETGMKCGEMIEQCSGVTFNHVAHIGVKLLAFVCIVLGSAVQCRAVPCRAVPCRAAEYE